MKSKVFKAIASRPGKKFTRSELERECRLGSAAVSNALRNLVKYGKINRHLPTRSCPTKWSIEADTRPETRPLREMTYPGAIFTPPPPEKVSGRRY